MRGVVVVERSAGEALAWVMMVVGGSGWRRGEGTGNGL